MKIILNKDWLQEYFNYFEGMNDFPAVFSIEIDEYSIDQGYAVPYDGILIEAEDAWPEDLYVEEDNVYVSDDLKDAIQKELNYFDEKGTTQVYMDSDYDELEISFFYQEKGEWTRPSARTGYRIEWA